MSTLQEKEEATMAAMRSAHETNRKLHNDLHNVSKERDGLRISFEEMSRQHSNLEKERDSLLKESECLASELVQFLEALEPSEPTFESALSEIAYLKDLERMIGKNAMSPDTVSKKQFDKLWIANSILNQKIFELENEIDRIKSLPTMRQIEVREKREAVINRILLDLLEEWESKNVYCQTDRLKIHARAVEALYGIKKEATLP